MPSIVRERAVAVKQTQGALAPCAGTWYNAGMRIPASTLFSANRDGTVTVTRPTKIGGVLLHNVMFGKGVRIGKRELTTLVDKDLEVEKQGNIYMVKGHYE